MLNERLLRSLLFIAVAAVHAILLLFLTFKITTEIQETPEHARIMRVTDLSEAPPPPPPPPPTRREESSLQEVEAIAEVMIETEIVPEQTVVAPGTLTSFVVAAEPSWDDYIPIHRVSEPPKFDEREIAAALVYPPIAQRSGIEGRVILELFVDRNGAVQRITILQENPKDRGFGEAAIRAFTGKVGVPAMANGEPVSTRYRYPVSFKIK